MRGRAPQKLRGIREGGVNINYPLLSLSLDDVVADALSPMPKT